MVGTSVCRQPNERQSLIVSSARRRGEASRQRRVVGFDDDQSRREAPLAPLRRQGSELG